MSEKHEHRRDDQGFEVEHRRVDDYLIPASAKWIASFINRIGFPIFAFCLLAYFYFIGLKQNTVAINELKEVMLSIKTTLDAHNYGRGR